MTLDAMPLRNSAEVLILDTRHGLGDRLLPKQLHAQFTTIVPHDRLIEQLVFNPPDLIVIGRSIPPRTALRICTAFRSDIRFLQTKIIVLASDPGARHEVDAFAAGANDYVSMQSTIDVVAARIKAALGLAKSKQEESELEVRTVGDMIIVADSYAVKVDGQHVNLTAGEFRVLWTLARHVGRIVSIDDLARVNARGTDTAPSDRAVRARVSSLRNKLGKYARYIHNVRGAGYRLSD